VLSEASEELDYEDSEDDEKDDSEDSDKTSSELESSDDAETSEAAEASEEADEPKALETTEPPKRERKRKRKDENEDLESKYLAKLTKDDEPEPAEKRQKSDVPKATKNGEGDGDGDDDAIPQHESLTKDTKASELEKADRTVFIANASSEAISSKSAKKTLLNHLSSVLDKEAGEKIESIRFRSVAFSVGSMPKRAAYITKQLMEATTKSTNAYVVYSTAAGARKSAAALNGTEVLGRHIRVDSVSHPTPTAHRRCVFVGNLGFVDDESVLNDTEDGETIKKKRNKVPSDVEEGLWRVFGKQGRVENVRVVRDPKTRVGKGFAYVQFYVSTTPMTCNSLQVLHTNNSPQDANSVESALLLDGKKFPPMLPRAIRVTRAKDPRKTALAQEREREKLKNANGAVKSTKYKYKATPEERSLAGRAGKLLGRAGAALERRKSSGKGSAASNGGGGESVLRMEDDEFKTPQQVVFEGTRATSSNGRPKDLKLGKKSKGKMGNKPTNRGARRAAEWRKTKN
jgi:nucleolar protein 12